MSRHCSYMGRPCLAHPECGDRECSAEEAFPFGGNLITEMVTRVDCGVTIPAGVYLGDSPLVRKAQVTVDDAEVAAAVRTLRHLGYIYDGGEQWKPPLGLRPSFESIPGINIEGELVEQGVLSLDATNGELGMIGLVIERPDAVLKPWVGDGGCSRVTIKGLSRQEASRMSACFLTQVRVKVGPA